MKQSEVAAALAIHRANSVARLDTLERKLKDLEQQFG